ncbi:MAG: sugar phosphate nucleotidyltransferase [Defluviitaleaceae bacterium]|nr:sugar phosphate nucleotidyltransferase [Defluviitaleaceae bacterium]MCL2240584.1 sugar phosphate nucleotidyltransferase [Defluviitaleaceae bacterium]
MRKPILVIMAAGLGSRYGGLKQIAPVDDAGHIIIEFSLYDAYRAGFRDVVCIINPANEKDFDERFGQIKSKINIQYAYQVLTDIPAGYTLPEGRAKPWGTAHAVLCAKPQIHGPFAVINADDFYGADAYAILYNFLENKVRNDLYAMVGYQIENTLTESGTVARGVCTAKENYLIGIKEVLQIKPAPGGAEYEEKGEVIHVPAGTLVSMNMFGFPASLLTEIENRFTAFLDAKLQENPLKCEYLLPTVVGDILNDKRVEIEILPTADRWHGVTYAEDMPGVRAAIAKMKEQGLYPQYLWK